MVVLIQSTGAKTFRFPVAAKEPEKEVRVTVSLNLALVPDCGVSCIEVYGRCMEKHSEAQRIYVIRLLMN